MQAFTLLTTSLALFGGLAGCQSEGEGDEVSVSCLLNVNETRWEPSYVVFVSWEDVEENMPTLAPRIAARVGETDTGTEGGDCEDVESEFDWLEAQFEADPSAEATYLDGGYALYFVNTTTSDGSVLMSFHPKSVRELV